MPATGMRRGLAISVSMHEGCSGRHQVLIDAGTVSHDAGKGHV